MTRRALFSRCAPQQTEAAPPPPTDAAVVNRFVEAFNLYADTLNHGLVDLRLWRAVWGRWGQLK